MLLLLMILIIDTFYTNLEKFYSYFWTISKITHYNNTTKFYNSIFFINETKHYFNNKKLIVIAGKHPAYHTMCLQNKKLNIINIYINYYNIDAWIYPISAHADTIVRSATRCHWSSTVPPGGTNNTDTLVSLPFHFQLLVLGYFNGTHLTST